MADLSEQELPGLVNVEVEQVDRHDPVEQARPRAGLDADGNQPAGEALGVRGLADCHSACP